MDVYYNKLNHKQLQDIKNEIVQACDDFKKLHGMKDSNITQTFSIFIYDNEKDFSQYGDRNLYYHSVGHAGENGTHVAYIYHNPNGDDTLRTQVSYALSLYNGGWDESKILPEVVEPSNEYVLDQEKTVDLDEYNLKVKIHYNDLNTRQLKAAEQEIKKTFSDFDKSFGLEKSDTARELQLYIYDNSDSYEKNTGRSGAYGVAHPDWSNNNVAKMSVYKFDDDGTGFTSILRHELAHALTFYCHGSGSGLTCGEKAGFGITSFLLEGIAYFIHEGSNLVKSSTFNPEDYYSDGRKLVSLLEHAYPRMIDDIIHNSKAYNGALEHFKKKFPSLVEHISDDESFPVYDQKFFERILENEKVQNKVAKLISAKPSKEEVQSYEDDNEDYGDEDEGSGMQYEMVNGRLQITNKNDDTFIVPKTFGYLKRVKEDGEEKFTLCNKKGKEYTKIGENRYINTEEIMNKSDNFDTFCSKKCHIEADKKEPQMAKIVDLKSKKEIGALYNRYEEDEYDDEPADNGNKGLVEFDSNLRDISTEYVYDDLI